MTPGEYYRTLEGEKLHLSHLSPGEARLVPRLVSKAEEINDWCKFDNYRMATVLKYYRGQGLDGKQIVLKVPYRIGQDLTARIGIAQGYVESPDYRGEIEQLVNDKFANRKAFCTATGLSESQLSHVLKKRKNLGLDTLEAALSKIGYRLKIVPA